MDVTKLRIYEKQKEESVVLSSFAVTRLGLEPKTPSLKGMCSTS